MSSLSLSLSLSLSGARRFFPSFVLQLYAWAWMSYQLSKTSKQWRRKQRHELPQIRRTKLDSVFVLACFTLPRFAPSSVSDFPSAQSPSLSSCAFFLPFHPHIVSFFFSFSLTLVRARNETLTLAHERPKLRFNVAEKVRLSRKRLAEYLLTRLGSNENTREPIRVLGLSNLFEGIRHHAESHSSLSLSLLLLHRPWKISL